MLRPFQWCFLLAPILPNTLLESLEAPQPILVGITRTDFDGIEAAFEQECEYGDEEGTFEDTEDYKMKSWVFLDCRQG